MKGMSQPFNRSGTHLVLRCRIENSQGDWVFQNQGAVKDLVDGAAPGDTEGSFAELFGLQARILRE